MYNNKPDYQSLVKSEVKRLNDEIVSYHYDLDKTNGAAFDVGNHEHTDISLTTKLQTWYMEYRPAAICTNTLLQILNDEGLDVPSSVIELSSRMGCRGNDTTDALVMNTDVDNNFQHSAMGGSWHTDADERTHTVKRENLKDTNTVIKDLQEQQRQMNAKLNHMMREIAKVNVRLTENVGIENEVQKTSNMFPIENVTALADFENSLNDSNTGTFILTIKRIVNNDHLNKSLLRILSKDILLEHNLDGRQKKLALNVYPKLLNILYRSYENYESFSEFTWDLKHAMKRIKNRFHKANCISRKSIPNPQADPLMINAKYAKKVKQDDDDDSFF